MLFEGATSFWETLNGSEDFKGAGSLCHGWSAIPVYLYLKYASGISIDKESYCDVFSKVNAEAKVQNRFFCSKEGNVNEKNVVI